MDFEEFREKLKEDLGERLFARTGDDFEITSSSVTKLQNAGYEGITVRKEGEAVGINLDVADFYKGLESGAADYDSVLDKITEIAIHGFEEAPAFNVSDLGNYEVMKEHLSMQVVQTERNAEMLETIPHKEIEDMSVVCRFIVSSDGEGMDYAQATPSLSQAQRIKKLSQDGKCTYEAMCAVMDEEKKPEQDHITLKHDVLQKYFPKSYTPRQMQEQIIKLLDQWQKHKQRSECL